MSTRKTSPKSTASTPKPRSSGGAKKTTVDKEAIEAEKPKATGSVGNTPIRQEAESSVSATETDKPEFKSVEQAVEAHTENARQENPGLDEKYRDAALAVDRGNYTEDPQFIAEAKKAAKK